jgi:hypothetical protein
MEGGAVSPVALLDKIKAHAACDWVSVESDCVFVYLKPGWEWSGQTSFGCATKTEALKLIKQATITKP